MIARASILLRGEVKFSIIFYFHMNHICLIFSHDKDFPFFFCPPKTSEKEKRLMFFIFIFLIVIYFFHSFQVKYDNMNDIITYAYIYLVHERDSLDLSTA
jgi:hypothetical protein